MNLSVVDLTDIATELEKLSNIKAEITQIRVKGHYIRLKKQDDPRDHSGEYRIVGISNDEHPPGGVLR